MISSIPFLRWSFKEIRIWASKTLAIDTSYKPGYTSTIMTLLQKNIYTLFLSGFLFTGNAFGQSYTDTLDNIVPFDSAIISGKLDNGLAYYILPQKKMPKVVMSLVVKAGSNQEKNDQLELAHLLEHLAFVRSKHFNNPREYFISRGLKFGEDLNAKTRPEHIRYLLKIPYQNEALLDTGLLFLRDCAQDFTLSPADIDKERGVILGELRRSTSETSELDEQFVKYILSTNDNISAGYASRKKNIESFDQNSLLAFYNDWFVPENEFILIIGNVNVAEATAKIKSLFSDVKSKASLPPRTENKAHFNPATQVYFAVHPQKQNLEIQIHLKMPFQPVVTYGDMQTSVVEDLYYQLMSARFATDETKEGTRLYSAFRKKFSTGRVPFSEIIAQVICSSETDAFAKFKVISTELERVKRYGFSHDEISQAKRQLMRRFSTENAHVFADVSDSYIDYLTDGSPPAPGMEQWTRITRHIIENVTDNFINEVIKAWLNSLYVDIVFLSPENEKTRLPSSESVVNWWKALPEQHLDPFIMPESVNSISSLTDSIGKLKSIENVHVEEDKKTGIKKIKLNNGITILVKNIESAEPSNVELMAIAPGGSSIFPDSVRFISTIAPAVVQESGIGNLNKEQLTDFLKRNELLLFPYVSRDHAGFYGRFNYSDITAAMQTIYGYVMLPRMDTGILVKVYKDAVADRSAVSVKRPPEQVFADVIANSTKMKLEEDMFDNKRSMDIFSATKIYNQIFTNTENFTFILTGSFPENPVLNEVVKYLSRIPRSRRPLTRVFQTINPRYQVNKTVYAGTIAEKAKVNIKIYGSYEYSFFNAIQLDILSSILYSELMEELRVRLGGTYEVSVATDRWKMVKNGFYTYTITFECAPNRLDELTKSALTTFERLKSKRYIQQHFDSVRREKLSRIKIDMEKPEFWSSYIKYQLINGSDLNEIGSYSDTLQQISVASLQRSFSQWLDSSRISVFKLLPERFNPQ